MVAAMVRAELACGTAVGLALAATGCGAHSHTRAAVHASPLGVVSAATPRFPFAHFLTRGAFPQVRDGRLALGAVNLALRKAIVADQRAFEPYARRHSKRVAGRRPPSGYAGYYETELDRPIVSASTVVVSALIPRTRAALPPQSQAFGWLGITIRVPSGTRVALPELFARRAPAMRVLEARIRSDNGLPPSVRRHPAAVLADGKFALLPSGLAVGVEQDAWPLYVLVPYSALRPYLSRLGLRLVAGTRWPDFRPDREHFSYCRRPDNSGAALSATGDVPCATARRVEAAVFSPRCGTSNRCVAFGFTCLAYWDGRYDRPFTFTHHAICHDGKRRIVMDEGVASLGFSRDRGAASSTRRRGMAHAESAAYARCKERERRDRNPQSRMALRGDEPR